MHSNFTKVRPGRVLSSQRWMIVTLLLLSSATVFLSLTEQQQAASAAPRIQLPDEWVGQPFPLLDSITDGAALAQGDWLVLLADRGCPSCGLLADSFVQTAESVTAETAQLSGFCILSYGADFGEERHPAVAADPSRIHSLSIPSSAPVVPADRAIVHLRDATVIRVYAPWEMDLVRKVFGS